MLAESTKDTERVISDEEYVAAWHSGRTLREITNEWGLSEDRVNREWKRLRVFGQLPDGKRKVAPRSGVMDRVWDSDCDGRPTLKFEDPLLDRLYREHPEHAPK